MKRSEVKENLKWDLDVLFESVEKWEEGYENVNKLAIEYFEKGKTMLDSVKSFEEFTKFDTFFDRTFNNVYLYAHLKSQAETTDELWQKNLEKISSISNKYASEFADIKVKTIENIDTIIEMCENNKELNYLVSYYKKLKETDQFKLSEAGEKLVSKISSIYSNTKNGFSSLNNRDVIFEDAIDSEGKAHKLTHATYGKLSVSKDATLRMDAYNKMGVWYKEHRNIYASYLNGYFKDLNDIAKLRGHKDALSSSLFADRSNRKVLDALINSVNKNHEPEFKYLGLLKQMLNQEELNKSDLLVTPFSMDLEFDIEQQKEIMLTVSKAFKGDYQDIVQKCFDQRWIDWVANDGKRNGAFSSGFQDSYKYILLNDNGTLSSLSTLVHEVGHSLHSHYAAENNPYIYGRYTIMEAEVASTLNQLLLFDYLLTTANSKEEKIIYLLNLINNFRNTIYRQTMFAEFEVSINDHISNNEMLTADDFEEIYGGLLKKYFGNAVKDNEYWNYESYRIPHFYYNFYVYKYATGLTTSIALYSKLKENYEDGLENVYTFLKSGSEKTPLEVIKNAGVDLEDENTYQLAFDQFDQWVDELISLVNED